MLGIDVTIANRLEVLPGNVISVPGCEPISAFTSPTLAANIKCKASVVPVNDALQAIPGSTLVNQYPRKLFFVLPDGPPTTPGCNSCVSITDYYQILRDITPAKPAVQVESDCGISGANGIF